MPEAYQWLRFSDARAALAQRLADPSNVFWTDDENGLYIIEALRTWNAFVSVWNTDYNLTITSPVSQNWYPLSGLSGYPRIRTVTDTELYTLICYHLLEPPNIVGGWGYNWGQSWGLGGTPAGTGQFTIPMMAAALQRRRDEIIQMSACTIEELTLPAVPNIRRTALPDTLLEPMRNRWVPVSGFGYDPVTMWRNDDEAFEYYSPQYLQNQSGPSQMPGKFPQAWGVISGPPLSFDVDYVPVVPGVYDLLALRSGAILTPPVPTVVGLPDDWCWLAKWGAMSDLLGMESEATDAGRADYCLQRYKDGLKLMGSAPWLLLGRVNGEAVDIVSVTDMDQYANEWESNADAPQAVVAAGTDFVAVSPIPTADTALGMTVVGNAPVPVTDADYVQVSRDTWDVILDYSQHLAMFKQGGSEFAQSKELIKNFLLRAASENSRITELGLYRDILLQEGNSQKEVQPRFIPEE